MTHRPASRFQIRRARLAGLMLGAMALLCSGIAAAQDAAQFAPKEPARTAPGKISIGPAVQPAHAEPRGADDGKIILQALRGLRFVPRARDVVKAGVAKAGVDVASVAGLSDPVLEAQLQTYIGKPLTFGGLHQITRGVIAFLRAHRRPLADVAIPEQDVTAGVVQIVVTEFTLGRVRVVGNRWFSSSLIKGGVEAKRGKPPDIDQLRRDLDWLNRNPFRNVDAVFVRGDETGTADIQLNVHDRFPFRIYAGFDNYGAPVTGRNRWSAGVNFGNLFGADQQLSYQFSSGDDFFRHIADGKVHFMAHSLSYAAPLPWRDVIEVSGSYVRQRPDVGPFFGQIGHLWQGSARYVHAFGGPLWLDQELQFGFDYKTANNNLSFGGIQVFAASQDVDQFLVIYNAVATDSLGVTTFGNNLVLSPGGLTGNNADAAFAQSGISFAKARYAYDTLSLSRVTKLPYNASWVMRLTAQAASGDLLSSEQLGSGGESSVRGYEARAVNGSQGALLSEELRSPPFSLLDWAMRKSTADNAQLFVFWDYAHLDDPHTQPFNPPHFELESVGAGFNYMLGRTLDLRTDYGRQLLTLPGTTKRGSRIDLSLTLSY